MSKKKDNKISYGFTQKCPYCGAKVVLKDSYFVYHNNKNYGKMWVCSNYPKCDSYVGCHPGTEIPLGRLADSTLRKAKHQAHEAFDALWKSGLMTRREAYIWLSAMLHITQDKCHIGMFDIKTCHKVVDVCNKQNNKALNEYRKVHKVPRYSRGYKR